MSRFNIALILVALGIPSVASAQRRPLTVAPTTTIEHRPTGVRYRPDSSGRRVVPFQVEGKIEFVAASRVFLLTWNGMDGTRQRLEFQTRDKIRPVVIAAVTYDSVARLYTYRYTFSNLSGAEQGLQSLYLEGAQPTEARVPNADWYSRRLTPYLNTQLSVGDGWAFSNVGASNGIAVGDSLGEFVMISDKSPGIVKVFAEGRVPVLRTNEDLPEELHAAIDAVAWRIPSGLTVGPVNAALDNSAAAQLERLDASLVAAEAQGWLGQATIAASIRAEIGQARSALAQGDRLSSARQLDGIAGRVRAGGYPSMLSEARALLEFQLEAARRRIAGASFQPLK